MMRADSHPFSSDLQAVPAAATPVPAAGGDEASRGAAPRNPGPSWGYRFLRGCDRLLPELLFRPLRMLGTWFALARMAPQRRASREYLRALHRREPSLREVFRHFFAFEEFLMLRLRVACGQPHRGELAPEAEGFRVLLEGNRQALLGTFHLGHSDLTGFLLGPQERRRVAMVRQRVGNSHDTDLLEARFGNWIRFIWVNQAENLTFALKEAVASGASIAMKCDRVEFAAKTEVFAFLGGRRHFPFTIYHLALIFRLPVVLTVGLPLRPGATAVHSSPLFEPDGAGKAANLERAREHFQAFLVRIEALLRESPEQWFNFLPLNPVAP